MQCLGNSAGSESAPRGSQRTIPAARHVTRSCRSRKRPKPSTNWRLRRSACHARRSGSLAGRRRRPTGSAADYRRRCRSTQNRIRAWITALKLRMCPPVERLVSELLIIVPRRSKRNSPRRRKTWAGIVVHKVIQSTLRVAVLYAYVEPSIRCGNSDSGRCGGRRKDASRINSGHFPMLIDGVLNRAQSFREVRVFCLDAPEVGQAKHLREFVEHKLNGVIQRGRQEGRV